MADPVKVSEYTNTTKPFDVLARPFHRINAPDYDLAKDPPADVQPRPAPRGVASGAGRDCGCRGPEDLMPSVVTARMASILVDALNDVLNVLIPMKRAIEETITRINDLARKFLDTPDLDFPRLFRKEISDLLGKTVDGLLFGRVMRAVPHWVPVGRKKFDERSFEYDDKPLDGRRAAREEEREIEGLVVRSFQMSNDLPNLQWARFARWAFHVVPLPGFEYLVGQGNVPSSEEGQILRDFNPPLGPVVPIYNEMGRPCLECLIDSGAISQPPGDSASPDTTVPGIMFNSAWPFWPAAGDHLWAAGRWAYDCARVVGNDKLTPTQLNPLKAFATARLEGFKFVSNPASVPAVRFLFYATSEGGYVNFRARTDAEMPRAKDGTRRPGAVRDGLVRLADRDYTFVVDLPPAPEGRDRHPLGHTPDFRLNTIALRASLLQEVQQAADFTRKALDADTAAPDGVRFVTLEPIVQVLRPADRTKAPTQVRVTVPLKQLSLGDDARVACGFVLNLGWHDPGAALLADLVKVTVRLDKVAFTQSGTVRFKTGVNGRWSSVGTDREILTGHRALRPSKESGGEVFFLSRDGHVAVSAAGTRRHGFGEFREQKAADRILTVGGILDLKTEFLREVLKKFGSVPLLGGLLPDSVKAAIKALDDLAENVPEELLGPRVAVDWDLDVDTDKDQGKTNPDGTQKNARATAVARELTIHPTPIINKPDAPLGLLETLDEPTQLVRLVEFAPLEDGTTQESNLFRMQFMVEQLQRSNQKSLTLRFALSATRTEQVGGGNLLAKWLSPGPGLTANTVVGKDDYTLFGRVTVELP